MRKNFYLSGLFLCILALCVGGCGGSAADPMGTATVQFVDVSGSIITTAEVVPNGTITLRAKVTNLQSDGTTTPVVNEHVSFSIVNTGSSGKLTVVNTRTGSGGHVMVLYTAGNNMYSDIVRVITEGSGSTATIHINKTGGTADSRIATLTASSAAVAAGQSSIVTANVTDGASNPVMGEIVRFRLPVNESGAGFADAYADGNFYAYTDASGNATAIYTAGSAYSGTEVYDTVQAELENGSSNALVITRSAGTTTTTTELSISVAASPASVNAGQVSIVTATLTGDNNVGVTVTFSLPVNNSGATLSASSAVTDGGGKAVVVYQPGTTSPTLSVQDTVQAAVGTATSAVAITRVGSTASAYSITVAAAPSTLTVISGNSVITANVKNNAGTVVSGVTVDFVVTGVLPLGNLSVASATTDGSGNAVTTFTGKNLTAKETQVVTATVNGTTYTAAVIISNP